LFRRQAAGHPVRSNGAFFYFVNTGLTNEMRKAIDPSLTQAAFLESFKARGWYLDDLIQRPLGKMTPRQREDAHWNAADSLRDRIKEYRPLAIVSLLDRIKRVVQCAADKAGSNARVEAVRFPLYGQQPKFQSEMALILANLPTA
jgi:hypothetical protein